jgi:hypothetical protein
MVGPPAPPPTLSDMGVSVSTGMPPSFLQNQDRIGTISHTRTVPRRLFLSPAERLTQDTTAKVQADLDAKAGALRKLGVPEADIQRTLMFDIGGTGLRATTAGGAGAAWAEGEIVQNPSTGQWEQILYLRSDPSQTMRMPAMAPTLRSSRAVNEDEQLAHELFAGQFPPGTPPAVILQQLNPAQRSTLYGIAAQRRTALAGSTAGAAATAQQQAAAQGKLIQPIGVEAGAAQGIDPTTTLGELRGITPVTPAQRERLEAATNLATQMVEIDRLTRTVFPEGTGLIGGLTAAGVLATKRLRRDPDLAALEAALGLSLSNMARVLQNERGTLNEGDIRRAQDALTNLQISILRGDTQESALARLQVVNQAINKVKESIKLPAQQLPRRGPGGGPPPPPGGGTGVDPRAVTAGAYSGRQPVTTPDGRIWGQVGNAVVELVVIDGKYYLK